MINDRKIPIFRTTKDKIDSEELMRLILRHNEFQHKYKKAWDYYEGRHEIINKVIGDGKPNHICPLNYCQYIVNIRTGYFSGNPITLVSQDKELLKQLQDVLDYNSFNTLFSRLDEMSSIFGHANVLLYIDKKGNMKMKEIEPSRSFVVYDCSMDMNRKFGVIVNKFIDDTSGDIAYVVDVYDNHYHYVYQGSENDLELASVDEHFFGAVPLVEMCEKNDRLGSYECAYDIIDALEHIVSSNLNTIDYFGNAYLLLKNLSGTTQEDLEAIKRDRVMLVEDGDAYFISPKVESQFVADNFETLHAELFLLCKTPCLNDKNFNSNSSGVSISYKLFSMSKSVDVKQSYFEEGFSELFEMIVNVFNLRGNEFNARDVKQTYVRSLPQDMNNLADSISKLSNVVSQRSLLSQLDFISSADAEIEQFRAEQDYNMKKNLEMMDMYDDYSVGDGDESE